MGFIHSYSNMKYKILSHTNKENNGSKKERGTNVPKIRIGNKLTKEMFFDFENCYSKKNRVKTDIFKNFTKKDIEKNEYNLILNFVKNKDHINIENLPDPKIIASKIEVNLQTILETTKNLIHELELKTSDE